MAFTVRPLLVSLADRYGVGYDAESEIIVTKECNKAIYTVVTSLLKLAIKYCCQRHPSIVYSGDVSWRWRTSIY